MIRCSKINKVGLSQSKEGWQIIILVCVIVFCVIRPDLQFSFNGNRSTKPKLKTIANPLSRPHYLEELSYKYGSDKSKDDHAYTNLYQMLFDPIRHSLMNITEVGVSAGQSIQAWYKYFPNAMIHGYDVKATITMQSIAERLSDRVRFTQTDLLAMKSIPDEAGLLKETMDIVIEDAMHTAWHQETFLKRLFYLVKPGGYYIIEDINTGDPAAYVLYKNPEKLSAEAREILEQNDVIFVDTHIGHRAWDQWLQRSTQVWAKNHLEHNSHLMVIRKRLTPSPPVKMNFGERAMNPRGVIIDG